jgi:hypothetical protein
VGADISAARKYCRLNRDLSPLAARSIILAKRTQIPQQLLSEGVGRVEAHVSASTSLIRAFGYSSLGIITLVGLALFAHSFVPPKDVPTPPKNERCESDWTKCTDNAEIVRSYKGWLDVQVACRIAAIEAAKYGTPTWPFVPFQGFSEGKTYVQSGLVVAIEPEAKFPNSAGAMMRSRVTCTYDLRTRRVVNVAVSEG